MSVSRLTQRGLSLIEALLGVAILSVLVAVLSAMNTHHQRMGTQLADKLASLDLERMVATTLTGSNVCTFMLNSVGPVLVDPMNLGAVAIPPLTAIPSRAVASAEPVVTTAGAALVSPLSPRLRAGSIRIENLACATPPCTPATTQFTADLTVGFDTQQSGPVAPIRVPLSITTSGGPGPQTIANCAIATPAGGGGGGAAIDRVLQESPESCGGSPSHPNCTGIPPFVYATCPAGYQVTGCGYRLSTWNPQPSGAPPPQNNFHTSSPDDLLVEGNGCKMDAGGGPGCGVCFRAQAICLRIQ